MVAAPQAGNCTCSTKATGVWSCWCCSEVPSSGHVVLRNSSRCAGDLLLATWNLNFLLRGMESKMKIGMLEPTDSKLVTTLAAPVFFWEASC